MPGIYSRQDRQDRQEKKSCERHDSSWRAWRSWRENLFSGPELSPGRQEFTLAKIAKTAKRRAVKDMTLLGVLGDLGERISSQGLNSRQDARNLLISLRQREIERRARADLRVCPHLAAVPLNDLPHD